MFTQYSLGTFAICPVKFRRRYIENLRWKKILDKNTAKRMELGNSFHLLAERYFRGIDCGLHQSWEYYRELDMWLKALQRDFKLQPGLRYLPEYRLRMSKEGLRLEANFDLLVVDRDSIYI